MFTIFPGIFEAPLRESLLGRAIGEGLLDIRVHDLREWSEDRHRMVDDTAYGGGPGMVMKPEPFFAAVESLDPDRGRALLLSPNDAGSRSLVEYLKLDPNQFAAPVRLAAKDLAKFVGGYGAAAVVFTIEQ